MTANEKYQLATDILAYMIAWAPKFPDWIQRTFEQTFEHLCIHLDDLAALETRTAALAGIAQCRREVLGAKHLFDCGKERAGKLQMLYARLYLEFAAKGKPAPEHLFPHRRTDRLNSGDQVQVPLFLGIFGSQIGHPGSSGRSNDWQQPEI